MGVAEDATVGSRRRGRPDPFLEPGFEHAARRAGRPLYFGNYFPNDWKDKTGARLQRGAVYAGVGGELSILVARWRGRAQNCLAALAAAGDPLGCFASERERLLLGDPSPPGWRHLWHLRETEIFHAGKGVSGAPALLCDVESDVGILQREAPFPLRLGTERSPTRSARSGTALGVRVRMYEDTKHTSATEALRGGRRLEEVQHGLGHKDRRSTERYARHADVARVEDLFRRR
jgi:hypothetical protein